MNLAICIPVFNDWASVGVLLQQLDAACSALNASIRVVLIDDGSSEPPSTLKLAQFTKLDSVALLPLRRNLGHQRAIAIGLTYLHETHNPDAVVVLDADGEDKPTDIPALVERCMQRDMNKVIFAERAKRSEGSTFRLGYLVYRLLHRVLVGRSIRVGNFSVIPRSALRRLVCVSELWNHCAAAIYSSRIPCESVPTNRGTRIAGESKMNLVGLVVHGLSAISVHGETVAIRILVLIAASTVLLLVALAVVVVVKIGTALAIPGWATSAFGFILMALMNLSLITAMAAIFALRGRSGQGFIPLRDYGLFSEEETIVFTRSS